MYRFKQPRCKLVFRAMANASEVLTEMKCHVHACQLGYCFIGDLLLLRVENGVCTCTYERISRPIVSPIYGGKHCMWPTLLPCSFYSLASSIAAARSCPDRFWCFFVDRLGFACTHAPGQKPLKDSPCAVMRKLTLREFQRRQRHASLLGLVQHTSLQSCPVSYHAIGSGQLWPTWHHKITEPCEQQLLEGPFQTLPKFYWEASALDSNLAPVLRSGQGWRGAKRAEKKNLVRMARQKPFLETLPKWFLTRSPEGNSEDLRFAANSNSTIRAGKAKNCLNRC